MATHTRVKSGLVSARLHLSATFHFATRNDHQHHGRRYPMIQNGRLENPVRVLEDYYAIEDWDQRQGQHGICNRSVISNGKQGGSVAKKAKVVWDLVSEQEGEGVSAFKWRHFQGDVILWAVRWYCRYGISYRDLEQMMGERGLSIDHSTIYRWVQRYAPEMEKRLRWQWRCPRSTVTV